MNPATQPEIKIQARLTRSGWPPGHYNRFRQLFPRGATHDTKNATDNEPVFNVTLTQEAS